MDNIFPIVIALAVGCVVWAIFQIVSGAMEGDRRKIKQRLSGEARVDVASLVSKPISRNVEASGPDAVLLQYAFFQNMHRRMVLAYPDIILTKFLSIAVGVGIVGFGIGFMVTASPVFGLAVGLVCLYFPFLLAAMKRGRRQRAMANQLPEALDFLSRILRAGHSLSTGLQMMSEELPAPLAGEFRRAYDAHSLGQPLEDALKDLAARVDSTDFAFFVTAVLIQRQTGGDLSEVLNNISGMIRQRIRLQGHVKAKTAEGRFTGYILVAFPAVMFMISYALNPGYAGTLLHSSTGKMLLAVAFGLQMLGLVCIRKITTVKV